MKLHDEPSDEVARAASLAPAPLSSPSAAVNVAPELSAAAIAAAAAAAVAAVAAGHAPPPVPGLTPAAMQAMKDSSVLEEVDLFSSDVQNSILLPSIFLLLRRTELTFRAKVMCELLWCGVV